MQQGNCKEFKYSTLFSTNKTEYGKEVVTVKVPFKIKNIYPDRYDFINNKGLYSNYFFLFLHPFKHSNKNILTTKNESITVKNNINNRNTSPY